MNRATLAIAGMHCPACALAIDLDLEEIAGVETAETSFAEATTRVLFTAEQIDLATIIAAIRQAGYEAVQVEGADDGRTH